VPFTSGETFDALRAKARHLLEDRMLPPAPHTVSTDTPKKSELCAVCGFTVRPRQIRYEVATEAGDQKQIFHVHPNCHAAWEVESLK
jgi:hypothetical protein